MAPKAISCKAWNSPVEYPSRECKHDIEESQGNIFKPIFKENIQGVAHLQNQQYLGYRNPKHVVQNEN